jgi:hypothetical protein
VQAHRNFHSQAKNLNVDSFFVVLGTEPSALGILEKFILKKFKERERASGFSLRFYLKTCQVRMAHSKQPRKF